MEAGEHPPAKPARSLAWQAGHWAIAVSPFLLVLGLSVWGYQRYAWVPLLAVVLCPLGAALVGLQLARERKGAATRPGGPGAAPRR